MPTPLMKSFAKQSGKSADEVETLFGKAEDIVTNQYKLGKNSDKFYPLVVGVLKNMLKLEGKVSSLSKFDEISSNFIELNTRKNVSIIPVRLQPLTPGHLKMIEAADHPVVIVLTNGKKDDVRNNPLPFELRKAMLEKVSSNIEMIIEMPRVNLLELMPVLRGAGYEPRQIVCGSDRVKSWGKFVDTYKDLSRYNTTVKEVKRVSFDVSGTMVRELLRKKDDKKLRKLVGDNLADMYVEYDVNKFLKH